MSPWVILAAGIATVLIAAAGGAFGAMRRAANVGPEGETLRTWTILSAAVGITGVVVTILLATLFPMRPLP